MVRMLRRTVSDSIYGVPRGDRGRAESAACVGSKTPHFVCWGRPSLLTRLVGGHAQGASGSVVTKAG